MVLDILSWICLVSGGLVGVIGAIGIHRFPDFYSRLHATGITDTMCALLILAGLALQAGFTIALLKLGMICLFLFLTSPAATYALASAALHSGLEPKLKACDEGDKS